jgi:hypothetical protein
MRLIYPWKPKLIVFDHFVTDLAVFPYTIDCVPSRKKSDPALSHDYCCPFSCLRSGQNLAQSNSRRPRLALALMTHESVMTRSSWKIMLRNAQNINCHGGSRSRDMFLRQLCVAARWEVNIPDEKSNSFESLMPLVTVQYVQLGAQALNQ